MKKLHRTTILLTATIFLLKTALIVWPEFICMAVCVLLFIVLIACLGAIVIRGIFQAEPRVGYWWFTPLICIAMLVTTWYLSAPMGHRIADWYFKCNIASYNRVVEEIRSGRAHCQENCSGSVQWMQADTRGTGTGRVYSIHCNDGGVVVLFLSETDVPLLHTGFEFRDYGPNRDCHEETFLPENRHYDYDVTHITGPWYRFGG